MDSHISNESSELKNFVSSLRSKNLLKFIESNQVHFQEKCNSMCIKVRQSEDEISRQLLVLQQNSHLIEKFQAQLQELVHQNSVLVEKQQILKEENDNLRNQLQCSEDKFAQLDIFYDQQVSALTERINEIEPQMTKLENIQNKSNELIDRTQSEQQEKLTKTLQLNADLENQLKHLVAQQELGTKGLQSQVNRVNDLNETLNRKINNYEERVIGLQNSLAEAVRENRQITELKNTIEKLKGDRYAEQNEYQNEKSKLITANENLKMVIEDVQKKLFSKEKETEEIYLKFKRLSRFTATIPGHSPSPRKRSSTDDPKPIDNSSDSDDSTISYYKLPKKRQFAPKTVGENLFQGFQNRGSVIKKDGKTVPVSQNQLRTTNAVSSMDTKKRTYQKHIEIPESPVVTSSAFTSPARNS